MSNEIPVDQKSLARRMAWGGAGQILMQLRGFVTLPISIAVLGPAGLGELSSLSSSTSLVSMVAQGNLADGAGRLVVSADDETQRLAAIAAFRKFHSIAAIGLLIGGALLCVVTNFLALLAVAIWAAAIVLQKRGSMVWEYTQQTKRLSGVNVLLSYGSVATGLLVGARYGGVGATFGNGGFVMAIALWLNWKTRLSEQPRVVAGFWKHALKLALPLWPVSLSQWALFSLNVLMIATLVGKTEAGAYSVGNSIAAVGLFLPQAVQMVWGTSVQVIWQRERHQLWRTLRSGIAVCIGLGAAMVIGLQVVRPLLNRWLSDDAFANTTTVASIAVVSFTLLALCKLVDGVLYAMHATSEIVWSYTIGAIVTIACSYNLLQHIGIVGAAIGSVSGYVVTLVLLSIQAVRRSRREQ